MTVRVVRVVRNYGVAQRDVFWERLADDVAATFGLERVEAERLVAWGRARCAPRPRQVRGRLRLVEAA